MHEYAPYTRETGSVSACPAGSWENVVVSFFGALLLTAGVVIGTRLRGGACRTGRRRAFVAGMHVAGTGEAR